MHTRRGIQYQKRMKRWVIANFGMPIKSLLSIRRRLQSVDSSMSIKPLCSSFDAIEKEIIFLSFLFLLLKRSTQNSFLSISNYFIITNGGVNYGVLLTVTPRAFDFYYHSYFCCFFIFVFHLKMQPNIKLNSCLFNGRDASCAHHASHYT